MSCLLPSGLASQAAPSHSPPGIRVNFRRRAGRGRPAGAPVWMTGCRVDSAAAHGLRKGPPIACDPNHRRGSMVPVSAVGPTPAAGEGHRRSCERPAGAPVSMTGCRVDSAAAHGPRKGPPIACYPNRRRGSMVPVSTVGPAPAAGEGHRRSRRAGLRRNASLHDRQPSQAARGPNAHRGTLPPRSEPRCASSDVATTPAICPRWPWIGRTGRSPRPWRARPCPCPKASIARN